MIESPTWLLVINIAAWFVIQLTISALSVRMSESFILRFKLIFAVFYWERSGLIYEKFHIRQWKDRVPEAGGLFRDGFSKRRLNGNHPVHYETFVLETKRGELSHWFQLLSGFLFFLWNPFFAGIVMVVYALLFNLPFIMIQRYNRMRLLRVVQKLKFKLNEKENLNHHEVHRTSLSSDDFGV
jgi:glycosyl-4,4'-diaponeurosporenoate acyltransferase